MKNKVKTINLKELKKQLWEKKTFFEKMQDIWWTITWTIQEKWWLMTGTCPHESTINKVGNKKGICLLCKKIVRLKNESKKI